jgi:hypothetical protein
MDEPAERSNLPRHDIRFGRFYLIATESRIDAATRQALAKKGFQVVAQLTSSARSGRQKTDGDTIAAAIDEIM